MSVISERYNFYLLYHFCVNLSSGWHQKDRREYCLVSYKARLSQDKRKGIKRSKNGKIILDIKQNI